MKAVGLYAAPGSTGARELVDIELAAPTPGPHDLRVAVLATAVNAIDCALRSGAATPQALADAAPRIPGWDCAGIVDAVGCDVSLFAPGDRVFYAGALERPGGNAQLQLVDERIAGHMPQSLLFAEAAALPLDAIAAWRTLFGKLRIGMAREDAGKRLLVIGGIGGAGSLAIQLARHLGGLEVIACVGDAQALQACRELGADAVVDARGDVPAQLAALGVRRLDFVACLQRPGGNHGALLQLLKPHGRIADGGAPLPPREPALLHSGRYHQLLNRIARLVDTERLSGTLREHIRGIDARNLDRAYRLFESGCAGKIALSGFH